MSIPNMREMERRIALLQTRLDQVIEERKRDMVWSYLLPKYLRAKELFPDRQLPPFVKLALRMHRRQYPDPKMYVKPKKR